MRRPAPPIATGLRVTDRELRENQTRLLFPRPALRPHTTPKRPPITRQREQVDWEPRIGRSCGAWQRARTPSRARVADADTRVGERTQEHHEEGKQRQHEQRHRRGRDADRGPRLEPSQDSIMGAGDRVLSSRNLVNAEEAVVDRGEPRAPTIVVTLSA